ncbi:MAG: trimethylamine methyltransferase family protein [Treponema sp.]|nr:trimethylamine methyltransferase family protein [Treponema sp.]
MFDESFALPTLAMMSHHQCESIHHAALEILRRTGVRVFHQGALALLRETDAVISDGNLVRMPPALVEWALAQAPSRIALCKRGTSEVAASLEGKNVHFGTGSDCPNYLDPRSGERRRFTVPDLIDCIHLVDATPELDFCMSMGIPSELETSNAYRRQFALMLEHTTKPQVVVCDGGPDIAAITAMAAAAAGGIEKLRLNPTFALYSEPSTPLRHSETATDKLLFMAENRLPVMHSPAPMMGGTAPATMAGGLAIGTAEALSGLVMHQLKHRGAPFIFGSGLHHIDMRTMISVYGAPEFQLARVGVMEMGRYYGLPTWGYAGHSDSCVMDEQAASDATFSILVALLAGTNLAHDVGYLEAGMTASPEMMIFSAETITMMRRFMDGFKFDAESIALEVIDQVGPGGDFLTSDSTLEHFRDFWQPELFDRRRLADWEADGSRRMGARLRDKTISVMESHKPESLPEGVRSEIAYILKEGGK